MHENSFGSAETKPPLIWTETFCGKGKTDRVNEGASYVSSRAQRLAMRHKHHAVALNAFSANCSFGTQEKTLLKQDLPKALNSTASKVVLQAASSEYIKLMGRNKTIEENWVNLMHP